MELGKQKVKGLMDFQGGEGNSCDVWDAAESLSMAG